MLLEGLDLEFDIIVRPEVEENFPKGLGKMDIPVFLAEHKSEHYLDLLKSNTVLITADTIVWHRNELVGKPESLDEARDILNVLSGSTHEVVTGVCLRSNKTKRLFSSHSRVFFRELTRQEIDYYVENYRPLGKAGAYGIQEWIGYIGIEKIEGAFYNVMGLPVQMLYSELLDFLEAIS